MHDTIGAVRLQVTEQWYWRVRRPAHRLFLDIVWHLPHRVVYWCVVRAAAKVEGDLYPGGVTAEEMLRAFEFDHPRTRRKVNPLRPIAHLRSVGRRAA